MSFQIFLMSYILAFSAHSYAFSLAVYPDDASNATTTGASTTTTTPRPRKGLVVRDDGELQLAIVISSYVSCSLISLGAIIWVVFDSVVSGNIPDPMPLLAKGTFMCDVRPQTLGIFGPVSLV